MKIKQKSGATLPCTTCCASSFVRMFKPQFAPLVEAGTKLQTVRPTPKRMPKPGDKISLRTWTDKPYRSKQRVLRESVVTLVEPIIIERGAIWPNVWLDGIRLNAAETVAFAEADGFDGPYEFAEWFESNHSLPFVGVVIHWHNAKVRRGDLTENKQQH